MAGELFVADKKTLDETKNNTDSIIQNTKFIKEQFPLNISEGTDWSKYNGTIPSYIRAERIEPNETKTLLSINGEGFVRCIAVTSFPGAGKLIVKIDTTEHNFEPIQRADTADAFATGILQSGYFQTEEEKYIFVNGYRVSTRLTIKDGQSKLIACPLFFKSSLEIKINNNYSSAGEYKLYVIGGIKS